MAPGDASMRLLIPRALKERAAARAAADGHTLAEVVLSLIQQYAPDSDLAPGADELLLVLRWVDPQTGHPLPVRSPLARDGRWWLFDGDGEVLISYIGVDGGVAAAVRAQRYVEKAWNLRGATWTNISDGLGPAYTTITTAATEEPIDVDLTNLEPLGIFNPHAEA